MAGERGQPTSVHPYRQIDDVTETATPSQVPASITDGQDLLEIYTDTGKLLEITATGVLVPG